MIFKKSSLKQKNETSTPNYRINCFCCYELDTCSQDLSSNFTLEDSLFGGIKLAKNADSDKYINSGYGIEFNLRSEFLLSDCSMSKMVKCHYFLELI